MALSNRLLASVTVVCIAVSACHRRPAEDPSLRGEPTKTSESEKRDERKLEEQRRLASEIAALEKQQSVLKERMAGHMDAIARSERRVRDRKRDLRQQKAETSLYIDQHQLQVACAYAKQIARGEGEYSEKTRNCARTASMYCAFAMLSPAFRRNVAIAKKHVEAAEVHARTLKKQIDSEEQKVETEKAELRVAQESIDRLASDIAALRQQAALDHSSAPLIAPCRSIR